MKNPIFWIALFSLFAFLNQAFKAWRGFSAYAWHKVRATVQSVSIEEHDQGDGDIGYSANAQYTYQINGKLFTSSRLMYSDATQLSHHHAVKLLKGINAGCQIDAFYNPSRPSESVILKGIDTSSLVKMAIFGLICLVTIIMTLHAWFALRS